MSTVINAPSLVAPPHHGAVVAIYATTAAAATIKQYLIVARKAAWGLGIEKQITVGLPLKMGSDT